MAPKSKKRTSRMHAAIDAMRPLGFPPKTVQAAVKALLKEYGGDENWLFIEGDAYNLLISFMLEEQEGDNVKEDSSVGGNSQEEGREGANATIKTSACVGTDAGTSKRALSQICPKIEDTGSPVLQTGIKIEESTENVPATHPITSQPPKSLTVANVTLKPKQENSNGWLIENDDDTTRDRGKSNLAKNLARFKRKHCDL